MTKPVSILDAIRDPNLFAPWFKDPASWTAWRAFLCALFALPMASEQLAIYQQCTGRNEPPTTPVQEGWLVCGRRAGKSFILALVATFLAAFYDYRSYFTPGERGAVLVIARDRKQARVILRYIRAMLTNVPLLAQMVEREWSEGFDLSNSITIEVGTASFRSTRGYTIVAALCDEIAFWPTDDSAEPDYEVLNALRPGMATIPNAMLLCASSPYARRGALWDTHRKHFAKAGDPVLVWQAATRVMNATVRQSVIDEALERDSASAAAEWLAEFRNDVESFVAREVIEACVERGVRERPPTTGTRYFAFTDPSGGSADSFTLAIAHREADTAILDAIREVRPPFSPEAAVEAIVQLLRRYRVSTVTGDRYGGEWPREQFRKNGIGYEPSALPKSDLYVALLPAINSRQVDLLDHPKLIAQLCSLERRTARGGRDSIDHSPGGHDDLANCLAGVIVKALAPNRAPQIVFGSYSFRTGKIEIIGRERADALRDQQLYAPRPRPPETVMLRNRESGAVTAHQRVDAKEILALKPGIYEEAK